jgi:Arc/MetJ-type ribon-helix-helix transcriptional regulator
MPWTEAVTTTLPGNQVEVLRAMVAAGRAKSMSAWIAAAVAVQLASDAGRTARTSEQGVDGQHTSRTGVR